MGDEQSATVRVRHVMATRYVLPLREGGSLPGLIEADDDGLYVVKFRGAAQGPKTLIAELITGELGRQFGLKVPELVLMEIVPDLPSGEPDQEVQELTMRSLGTNLGMDFLPGALPFEPATRWPVDPGLAADIVWFDALTANVDRTTRNPNMLRWHDDLWLIDHGAAIYPHHRWTDPEAQGRRDFPSIAEHVLLPVAGSLVDADARLASMLSDDVLWGVISNVPDDWLAADDAVGDADAQRMAYFTYFQSRLRAPRPFVEGAEQLRTSAEVGAIDPDRTTRGRRRGA